MMSLSMDEILMAVHGEWMTDPVGGVANDVSTDSREINTGDLFLALKGERHDGHEYAGEAADKGAVAAIVERTPSHLEEPHEFGLIRVEDTSQALCDLAEHYRDMINARVIAVTGSGGKTTTKEMTAYLLGREFEVASAPKSYNNKVGVPLSLFKVDPVHDYVVLEIGTNAPGEIDALSAIARPDIGVLTNVSETHLKGLGSVEGVKNEKSDLFRHLTGSGFSVYNVDNRWVGEIVEEMDLTGVSFGMYGEADVEASDVRTDLEGVEFTVNDAFDVRLPIPGSWNVYNALAAIAVAKGTGIDPTSAAGTWTDFEPPSMRMQLREIADVTVLNDAYNANPRSMELFLDEVEHYEWTGRKILVLGDMAELGAGSERFHRDIGQQVSRIRQFDQVYFVGEKMKYAAEEVEKEGFDGTLFVRNDVEACEELILDNVRPGDLLALKGSRVMKLETLPDVLESETSRQQLQKN